MVVAVLLASCGGRVAGAPQPTGAAIAKPPATAVGDPDSDGDGIADRDDKCPNDAETFNGFEDEDGCPDRCRLYVTGDPVVVGPIRFSAGGTTIDASADVVIEGVAGLLQAQPEIVSVQIEGHAGASESGDPLGLSQKRADEVRAKLIARGIAASRLRAKGFGAHCPAVAGAEVAARRVELKVLRTSKGPTGVELGCAAAAAAGIVSEAP